MTQVAQPAEVVLDVEGMTCASCVRRVESALARVGAVEDASVNLADRTATVRTSADADVPSLIRAVEGAGYGARPHTTAVDPAQEYRSIRHRFTVAAVLTVPLLVVTFLFPNLRGSAVIAGLLTTPVVLYAGWPFFRAAARAARHGATTMDTLVVLGASSGYLYSVWLVATGSEEHYFDTAAVIVTLILLGRTLESRARAGATDAARTLLSRAAKNATVLEDGRERSVPIDELRPGHVVVVLPGEKVPADGVVKEGTSWIDLSLLTGESVPVDVGPGDDVVGASINGVGRIVVFVTKVGVNSALGQIVRLLQSAQASKAPVQRLADRISAVFVPVVVAIAVATFTATAWSSGGDAGDGLLRAAAVLLIACPCALGLATPVAIIAGTGRAAEVGVLFKGGEVFEAIRDADVALLDKTGTVTEGRMTLGEVVGAAGVAPLHVLAVAAAVELGSEHPIARAVVAGAAERGVVAPPAGEHVVEPGLGASAVVDGRPATVGRSEAVHGPLRAHAERLAVAGQTPIVVRHGGEPIGLIGVTDVVKPDAAEAVRSLEALGLDVMMVTGDRRLTAEAIAAEVGIERVAAEVYPEGKVAEIERERAQGRRVIFVGDGLNDAPALTASDVGIALGSGTDVALAAADVNLLGGSLRSVPDALRLARKTHRVIVQNLVWAFAYNVVMIPLAVVGALTPMWAAAAMAGSSLSVVLNALRLRRSSIRA